MSYIGNLNTHRGLVGKIGEDYATEYLVSKGHTILYRNRRIKLGEIDIISSSEGNLHFVEVKTVLSEKTRAEDHLDRRKLRKMASLAELFYKEYVRNIDYLVGQHEMGLSLDFVGVYLNTDKSMVKIVYLEGIEV